MRQNLDYLDLKILEVLGKYGPRNLTDVARKVGAPSETIRKRLKRLRSRFFLKLYASIYHTYLGLKKAIVFAEAIPGYEDLLFESLKANDFWIFVSRCYGMNEGSIGIYTVPNNHCAEFEQFLLEMRKLGLARNVQYFWSTCFQTIHSKCNWFNKRTGFWSFDWNKWIVEIPKKGTKLPYTLVDPQDFPIKGDEIDVLILKELEKDPTISFVDLAKILGMSPQLISYHYRKHIIGRGLLEGFQVGIFHFGKVNFDLFYFIFNFQSEENMAKFALSLIDKPFVLVLGKILKKNSLLGYLYLPKNEFRRFINVLSKLIRHGLLHSYQYVIKDIQTVSRQTISYEYFKDGKWIYNHKKHINNLQSLVINAKSNRSHVIEKYA